MARGGQYPPELSFAHQYTGLGTQHLLKPRTTIPHRVPLTLLVGISCPTSTGLSTRALWLFGLPLLLIIVFQLFACGPVCDVLPVGGASYIDLREVLTEFRLFNQPQWTNRNAAKAVNPVPMLIPRCVARFRALDRSRHYVQLITRSVRCVVAANESYCTSILGGCLRSVTLAAGKRHF